MRYRRIRSNEQVDIFENSGRIQECPFRIDFIAQRKNIGAPGLAYQLFCGFALLQTDKLNVGQTGNRREFMNWNGTRRVGAIAGVALSAYCDPIFFVRWKVSSPLINARSLSAEIGTAVRPERFCWSSLIRQRQ